MKVVFCAYDVLNYVGGPNAWLRRLLPELRAHDVQPEVLFLTDANPQECPTIRALRQQGIESAGVMQPKYTEQRVRWLLQKLAADPPDIFVPNLMVPAYYAARWVREAGIPTVGVLHSGDPFHRGLLSRFVFGDAACRLSALVCVSKFLEQFVTERQPLSTQIWRIPCGVPLPSDLAQAPRERLRLAYVGRLVEEAKRISEVTQALCRVVRQVPNTEAAIYGDGPARSTVEQILSSEGSGLQVHLVGSVDSDELQRYLVKNHVLVLLSDYEGLPIAVMEAMACGVVPITLHMRSGIPELVEDGVTGLLVEDRNSSFVAAVKRLNEELGLWGRLSVAARAKIEAGFTNRACAERWAEMLHELYHQAEPRRPLRIPRGLDLPPLHPDLAREDQRAPRGFARIFHYGRRLAGYSKRRLRALVPR